MKAFAVVLLFVSAAGALNSLVGLPDATFKQVEHLLRDAPLTTKPSRANSRLDSKDTLRNLEMNDYSFGRVEDGGLKPAPVGKYRLSGFVQALHVIIPAIAKLKAAKDKFNEEQFLMALKERDDGGVKAFLGKHVILTHKQCIAFKLKFVKGVHKAKLFKQLGTDDLDFEGVMEEVLKDSEASEADIFEAFEEKIAEHNIQEHPRVKVLKAIGNLVAKTACGEDGLVKKFVEMLMKKGPDDCGKDLGAKIVSFVGSKQTEGCEKEFLDCEKPVADQGPKEKLLKLTFGDCKEVKLKSIREGVRTFIDQFEFIGRAYNLKAKARILTEAFRRYIGKLMQEGEEDKAFVELGEFVLKEARRGILIRIAVAKKSESDNPPPSREGRPSAAKRLINSQKRTPSFIEDELDLFHLPENLVKT